MDGRSGRWTNERARGLAARAGTARGRGLAARAGSEEGCAAGACAVRAGRGAGTARGRGLAAKTAAGSVRYALPSGRDAQRAGRAARRAVASGLSQVDRRRRERERLVRRLGDPAQPWIYLIVATGDIYEDIPQAQAAAREGADIIAVIRSTGQSLLDYVPEGA